MFISGLETFSLMLSDRVTSSLATPMTIYASPSVAGIKSKSSRLFALKSYS
ncbi:hypothetical protein M078_4748, partial [Bacteroides fragilis str. 2-F-2 